MNTSDLQRALEDRMNSAVDYAYERAEESQHTFDVGFREGMLEAQSIMEGIFYQWAEMVAANSRRDFIETFDEGEVEE